MKRTPAYFTLALALGLAAPAAFAQMPLAAPSAVIMEFWLF